MRTSVATFRNYAALFLLLLTANAPSLTAQTPNVRSFFFPPDFAFDGAVLVDFNNDGKMDLLTPAGAILINNGDGTFNPTQTLAVSGLLGTGDFNGDGKLDIVVASSASTQKSLSVYLGNGDGTFQAPVTTTVGNVFANIAVADFNGDGKADVAFISPGLPLTLMIGKGDGTFAAPVQIGSPIIFSVGFATNDFNHDGKADLLIVLPSGNLTSPGTAEVLLGKGDGTFQTPLNTPSDPNGGLGAVIDLNGDGKLDIVTGSGQIQLGNGDGTFQAALPNGLATSILTFADLNHDGKLDYVNGAGTVCLGNGDATFHCPATYYVSVDSSSHFAPVLLDFNGDGNIDIGLGFLMYGNGDGTFQGINTSELNAPFADSNVVADFNGDGNLDIAAFSKSAGQVYVALGDGTGKFHENSPINIPQVGNLYSGDFNGDGKLDLLVVGASSTTATTWSYTVILGNGDGTFQTPLTSGPFATDMTQSTTPIFVADFNGDHISDFAVLHDFGVGIHLGQPDGTFAAPVFTNLSSPTSFVVGDFDADGKPDVAISTPAGVNLLFGRGDGTFANPVVIPINLQNPLTNAAKLVAAADVNGDGNLDLILGGANAEAGPGARDTTADILLGNGDGTFGPLIINTGLGVSSGYGGTALADIDGDGIPDIVTSNSNGLNVILGKGDGTFAGTGTTLIGPGLQSVSLGAPPNLFVGDFNNDGRIDIDGGLELLSHAPAPAPNFVFAAPGPKPSAIAPGDSTSTKIVVTPVGTFASSVGLSCTGLPSGAQCNFSPASLAKGAGTSVLTIATSATTPVGTYSVQVVATASPNSHSRALKLVVANSVGVTTISLTPQTLQFSAQPIGSASSAQAVTLTNSGTVSMMLSGVALGGTNAADFSQTTNCGSQVAAGASCQISVIFTPGGIGPRSASLVLSDDANGSPQSLALTGSGPDFSIDTGTTSSTTVSKGQTATYSLSLSPSAGFAQNVSLTCSGAPASATCSISPNSVSLSGSASTTAAVSVTTTASSNTVPSLTRQRPQDRFPLQPSIVLTAIAILAAFFLRLVLVGASVSSRRIRIRWAPVLAIALVCICATLASCGGGPSSSSSSGSGTSLGTPSGSYTIKVTATATGSSATLVHTTNLTLVVQ
jgi:hypothetical protein